MQTRWTNFPNKTKHRAVERFTTNLTLLPIVTDCRHLYFQEPFQPWSRFALPQIKTVFIDRLHQKLAMLLSHHFAPGRFASATRGGVCNEQLAITNFRSLFYISYFQGCNPSFELIKMLPMPQTMDGRYQLGI